MNALIVSAVFWLTLTCTASFAANYPVCILENLRNQRSPDLTIIINVTKMCLISEEQKLPNQLVGALVTNARGNPNKRAVWQRCVPYHPTQQHQLSSDGGVRNPRFQRPEVHLSFERFFFGISRDWNTGSKPRRTWYPND